MNSIKVTDVNTVLLLNVLLAKRKYFNICIKYTK